MSASQDPGVLEGVVLAPCRTLKLPTVGRECSGTAQRALSEGWHPLTYLHTLLDAEVALRSDRAVERRLRAARLPARKTLAPFDGRRPHGLDRARVEDRARCAWVPSARHIVFLGPVGTAKTHLASALAIEAIRHGHTALFPRAADRVRTLTESRDSRSLGKFHERLRRVQVLVVDELGFVPFDKAGGELLFDVFAARPERSATIVTSNLAFSEWGRVFGDDTRTAALLDRLAQHAEVLVTRGQGARGPAGGAA